MLQYTGRRMCLGENLVRNNLFVLLTHIVDKYQVVSDKDQPPSLMADDSCSLSRPYPYRVILKKRTKWTLQGASKERSTYMKHTEYGSKRWVFNLKTL